MSSQGKIRAGMGGWTFEPWDTSFYPDKLSKAKQLQYASRQVPTHRGQRYLLFQLQASRPSPNGPAEAPDGFVYSLKGNRFVTNRRVLGEAGESMSVSSVPAWWSSATSLARSCGSSRRPRNSIRTISKPFSSCCRKSRTASRCAMRWRCGTTVSSCRNSPALARKYKVAIVYADHAKYPAIADVTGDFIYARLQTGSDDNPDCYTPKGARRMGGAGKDLGGRQGACRSASRRPFDRGACQAARCVRLLHHRRQSPRALRRHGADETGDELGSGEPSLRPAVGTCRAS